MVDLVLGYELLFGLLFSLLVCCVFRGCVYVGVMLLVFVVMISGLVVNSVDIYRFFGIWFLFVCCIVVIVLGVVLLGSGFCGVDWLCSWCLRVRCMGYWCLRWFGFTL